MPPYQCDYPSPHCGAPKLPDFTATTKPQKRSINPLVIVYPIIAVLVISLNVGCIWSARRSYYKKKRQEEAERRLQAQEQEQDIEIARQFQEREENIDMVRRAEEGHGDLGAAGASSGNGGPNWEWPWYRNEAVVGGAQLPAYEVRN